MPIRQQPFRLSALCRNRLAQKCALILLTVCSFGVHATENSFAPSTFEEQDAPKWEEASVQLPDYPADADLLPFYVGPTARQDFFVDGKSISVGGDGVVRFTLVSKSRSGAVNVSYEGIRCQTAERKQYAIGRDNRTWFTPHQDNWKPITELVANRQHAALYKDYFCEGGTVAGNAVEITKRIREKRAMAPDQLFH